jgi:hypothetical protein
MLISDDPSFHHDLVGKHLLDDTITRPSKDRLETGRVTSFNPASRKSLEAGATVGISDVQSIAAEVRLYMRSHEACLVLFLTISHLALSTP